MSELKTLKDIKFESILVGNASSTLKQEWETKQWVTVEDLRQEAIKWIKEIKFMEYKITSNIGLLQEVNGETAYFEFIQNWIKYFFNISEDDLK